MDIRTARVVVVEDDTFMSDFVLSQLRFIGILDVHPFDEGGAALADVARLKPDLIITDVHMRPVGGIEFVRELREHADSRICNIPVIFLSADSTKGTVGEALPLGVAGYLVKPPSIGALKAKIELALKR